MIVRARAPMRISFAGGGTEIEPYLSERGGVVLSTTIDRYVQGCLRPETQGGMRLHSLDGETMLVHGRHDVPPQEIRRELVLAAMKRLGIQPPGFSLLLWSDAPPGSGLGSSSALVVTVLGLFRQWRGILLPDRVLAELAYEIERCELCLPGGKQDQYAAAFGGFNRIEFTREGTFVTPLHLGAAIMNELHS
ncbi:MAG: GHMP kinase, partial [Firmicutes bacterium]|nr:GHMP kinase [Bacillota bacterium]